MNKFLIYYKINTNKELLHEHYSEYNKIIYGEFDMITESEINHFYMACKELHQVKNNPIIINIIKLRG